MSQIREIFRTFGPEYIQHFGDAMPAEHRKVIDAIRECRTESFGNRMLGWLVVLEDQLGLGIGIENLGAPFTKKTGYSGFT